MKILSKLRRDQAKIHSLSWPKRILLMKVLAVLVFFKLLLILFPLKWFIKPVPVSYNSKKTLSRSFIDKQIWAIKIVSARVPMGLTCLVQALAGKWLLKNHPDVRVHIGVRNNSLDGFSAHAWVTYQHNTILGEQPNLVFEPILAWN